MLSKNLTVLEEMAQRNERDLLNGGFRPVKNNLFISMAFEATPPAVDEMTDMFTFAVHSERENFIRISCDIKIGDILSRM